MSDKLYTDADEVLAVEAYRSAPCPVCGRSERCRCRVPAEKAHYRILAVLDALIADGWQPPSGTVGRCGHQMPHQVVSDPTPLLCELPAGHDGWHRSGVTEWGAYMRRPRRAAKPDRAEG